MIDLYEYKQLEFENGNCCHDCPYQISYSNKSEPTDYECLAETNQCIVVHEIESTLSDLESGRDNPHSKEIIKWVWDEIDCIETDSTKFIKDNFKRVESVIDSYIKHKINHGGF